MGEEIKTGDLMWGKVESHPWWPGIVCTEPNQKQFKKSNHKGNFYYMKFLSNPPSRGWVKEKYIKIFQGTNKAECRKVGVLFPDKKPFQEALLEAEKAHSMSNMERLKYVQEAGDSKLLGETEKPTTFIIGQTPIPKQWETVFVLMSTKDIPQDIAVTGSVKVGSIGATKKPPQTSTNGAKAGRSKISPKRTLKEKDMPRSKRARKNYKEMISRVDDLVSDEDPLHEEAEEVVSDSEGEISSHDEEEDWRPSSKKKYTDLVKIPIKKFSNQRKKNELQTLGSIPQSSNAKMKTLVIDNSSSSGFEPKLGDFMIEKSECKDGTVPCIWKFKKGDLIQKYEKTKQDGQILYQNVLSFCDWWQCYSNRYQKVDVKLMLRYKGTEKVMLLETFENDEAPSDTEMEDESIESKLSSSNKANAKDLSATDKTNNSPSQSIADTTGGTQTQEHEVSSTTPDISDFQIGQFVLDKKDERNTDNFSVWKVETGILLRKYEPCVRKGKLFHEPMKVYRGYKDRDIHKFYTPIKVTLVPDIGTDFIEVREECKPKVVVDSSMEEEYDKHPLLRHFYVYLQVFLSQALEPGFLENVHKNQEDSFIFPLGEIDKIIDQKMMNVERKVRWTNKIKQAMQTCPFLREVHKPDSKRLCEAISGSVDRVEENVFLFGPEYDHKTLHKESEKSVSCQDFRVGKMAVSYIGTYHKLCHFKYNLFNKCDGKVKIIREQRPEADVTEIMDACLGNKAWVLQNFQDFMQLVEIGPC